MEKIRVNMTPCEEVKTIHASQNDIATRKWAFDLYDENGKIDSSSIKEQMIFDSRVGGTEQILPENTSDPTTSPIIADIQYPDSLRSEQTFLYRESPTQEGGQAKITRIKGNTVVFNQLIQNGNFENTSNWVASNGTLSVSNNELNVTKTGGNFAVLYQSQNFIIGNKYFIKIDIKSSVNQEINSQLGASGTGTTIAFKPTTQYQKISNIVNASKQQDSFFMYLFGNNGDIFTVKNAMMINLTAIFGSGNEPSTVSDFETWLSNNIGLLPYYAYTQGKLLPFLGEELKITGKNLFNKNAIQSSKIISFDTGFIYNNNSFWTSDYIDVHGQSNITVSGSADFNSDEQWFYDSLKNPLQQALNTKVGNIITIPSGAYYYAFSRLNSESVDTAQVEFGSSASSYEPYTENTISLPTLTYFSSGMKSAGSVYDEITESKAITRIGSVDLGTLTWTYESNSRFSAQLDDVSIYTLDARQADGMICSNYIASISGDNMTYFKFKGTGWTYPRIYFHNTSYSDATAFKQAMADQNVKLYYELATPTEESITTASLVTEKGETPLYYDDELIADCNETISSESGIFDAKIKLMDDETVYSQKIQLHVERKPQ